MKLKEPFAGTVQGRPFTLITMRVPAAQRPALQGGPAGRPGEALKASLREVRGAARHGAASYQGVGVTGAEAGSSNVLGMSWVWGPEMSLPTQPDETGAPRSQGHTINRHDTEHEQKRI